MTSGDEARLNASVGKKLEALFDYVEAQGWCPMPNPWNRLWDLMIARSSELRAPLPGPPLILAA
jgi:hypothetical protein